MAWISQAFSTYILHFMHGNGYQFWSGMGSDIGEATIVTALVAQYKHRNCHEKGCWRMGHQHPITGAIHCKHHWNIVPDHVPDEWIKEHLENGTLQRSH